jgi:DivIVA domain-containing protein
MEMSREVIENFQFRESRKGYDMREVDDFLEKLAVAFAQVQERLREAEQRAEAAQARVAEAQRRAAEAERRVAESESQPRAEVETDETETLRRTLILAQRTADAAIKEAEEHARQVRAEAEAHAAGLRSSAEAEARVSMEEARRQVTEEMHQLEGVRDSMQQDIRLLEAHVEEHRERLRASVNDLQRVIDDPASLVVGPSPEITGASAPVEEEVGWQPDDFTDVEPEPPAAVVEPGPAPEPFVPLTFDDDVRPAAAPAPPPESSWLGDEDWAAPAPAGDDDGPPTEAVDALGSRDAGDDEYLAELRKAMTDDSPLGPRDDEVPLGSEGFFDQSDDRPARSRFGRRR